MSYDGGAPIRQTIEYGRDGSFLDFMALTEHFQMWRKPAFSAFYGGLRRMQIYWDLSRLFTREYTEPGRFEMVLGYEGGQQKTGAKEYHPRYHGLMHKNVYYREHDGPPEPSADYFEFYGGPEWDRKVIIVPHHTRYPIETTGQDWSHYNERLQRLVEVYSNHGDSMTYDTELPMQNVNMLSTGLMANYWVDGEAVHGDRKKQGLTPIGPPKNYPQIGTSVMEALARGLKMGFIGSGDGHSGHPGRAVGYGGKNTGGLAAVLATGLSREAIWEAMYNRRTYATTGERILLNFLINGSPMGSEISAATDLKITGRAHGTRKLRSVELLKNNQVIRRITPEGADYTFDWSEKPPALGKTDFYFLRIRQDSDGEQPVEMA